jgi:hypothetical protein
MPLNFNINTFVRKLIASVFVLTATRAKVSALTYTLPYLSLKNPASTDAFPAHVVIERVDIQSATHSHKNASHIPHAGLPPFKVSNFTSRVESRSGIIDVTLTLASGTVECTIPVTSHIDGDNMYPCGKEAFFGYPKVGHVAILGYTSTVE